MNPSHHGNGDDGKLSRPPFREPRLLAVFGKRRSDEVQRLTAEMAETWCRASGDGEARCPRALELITLAASELSRRRREAAWALSLAARRELVYMLGDSERRALSVSIRHEAEKLSGWRSRAVEQLTATDGRVPDSEALAEALVHIDAGGSNQARGQRVLRRELAILALVLLAVAGALVVLVVTWLPAPERQPSPSLPTAASFPLSGLATDQLAVLAALFGALGSCISSIQRATSRPKWERVPGLRVAMWGSLTRPLVGAAAGLVVWAFAAEGILGSQGLGLLTFAFAAGFSERVILRFIPETPDSSGKPPDGPSAEGKESESSKGRASS